MENENEKTREEKIKDFEIIPYEENREDLVDYEGNPLVVGRAYDGIKRDAYDGYSGHCRVIDIDDESFTLEYEIEPPFGFLTDLQPSSRSLVPLSKDYLETRANELERMSEWIKKGLEGFLGDPKGGDQNDI
jgi:hypothetical protein